MVYNLLTYLPGYGYYPPQRIQEYTPIVINFKAAMLTGEDEPVDTNSFDGNKPQYFVKISFPRSTRKGANQHISDSVVIPIGSDGIFRYKLAPSGSYYPQARYIVQYFKRKNKIPLDTQEWLVPPIPKTTKFIFNYQEDIQEYVLPLNLWRVINLSPVSEYVATYNSLTLLSTIDFNKDDAITVTYEPAVTLDQLLEYNVDNFADLSRVRY
jgi:hypothetical protein